MANPGSKFTSVNLNKSYGQQNHPSHHTHYSSFNGGSYGQAAGRGRGGIGGGGGGMVVLSRNRGGPPKAVVSKLSVPPPLNLPSLRKEHEKFDLSGQGGGAGGGGGAGSGPRPSSSGVGWTKPVAAATSTASPLDKNEGGVETPGVVDGIGSTATDGVSRGSGSYMPPSARSNGVGLVGSLSASRNFPPSMEKAVVLRGEDFPSLQAARPVSSGGSQKQKDGLNQKQKQVVREESGQDKRDSYHLGPVVDIHQMGQSSRNAVGNRLVDNDGGEGHGRMSDQIQKQEKYFPDPMPVVPMNPRSDWADDERDTGRGFVERRRESGYSISNSESYWDRDFDLPRPGFLPHKPPQNQYDRRGQRDNETGKNSSSEVLRMDPYHKDVRASSSREGREVGKLRTSPLSRDGFNNSQEVGNYRNDGGARMAGYNNNMVNENVGRQQHQQQRYNSMESFDNRGADRNSWDRYRYKSDGSQNNMLSKPSFASSVKMPAITDPILTMGREKRYSKGDRSFSEDPFLRDFGSSGFDERDLLSGGLVGVIKRKKDAAKSTDFHDPVRESFEAELERVQKMQELERQRVVEEQERALEHVRREEEERLRRIRDEEERRRRMEEEAREAAWRAEQERVEAIRKAEELRVSREEEKRRMHMEEERRKEAARQKLEELEARMAKRQAETGKSDASVSNTHDDDQLEAAVLKEKDISQNLDLDTWEDGERMVENVTASAPFDSSGHNSRSAEMGLRPYPPREGSSNFLDRGKGINSWRRDVFNGDGFPSPLSELEMGHYSPRRDAFGGGGGSGGAGYMSSRASYLKEPYADEFGYQKDHRWGLPGDMDSEYHDSVADSGWGPGRARGNTRPPYPDQLYPHSDANELYSYGRSRYSVRQPRVLPPPSIASAQRTNFRGVTEHSGPSTFLDNEIHFTHAARSESTRETAYYGGNNQGVPEPSNENNTLEDQKLNDTSRCDSQSSLSVSSPPNSPPHDDLDESGDSPVASAVTDGKRSLLTGSGSVVLNGNNSGNLMPSDSISGVEDEEWTENDDMLEQQEEYDEDEDGYREEEEARDENLETSQKFEGLELEDERESSVDNVVLGFDEGVEVVIPSDDLEKNLGTTQETVSSFGIPDSSCVERGPVDEHSLVPADNSYGTSAAATSSGKVPEKSALEGSTDQPVSSSNDTAAQTNMPSAGNPVADLPVKLQFGLFSGPSLIPSPIPAIQIGSIQMPLHIHPPIGPSLPHMHPSQPPPMFQFGQLRYTSPISQGILPMAPQSLSFVQPSHFNLNPNAAAGPVPHQPASSTENVTKKDEVPSISSISKQPTLVSAPPEKSKGQNQVSREDNSIDRSTSSGVDKNIKSGSGSQPEKKGLDAVPKARGSENQVYVEKNFNVQRGVGPSYGGRGGRRFAYAVKNANPRSSFQGHDNSMAADYSNGFQRRPRRMVQRTEFRVRENNNNDRRQAPPALASSSNNTGGLDDKPNSNYMGKAVGVFTRSGSKRGTTISNRSMKQRIEPEPENMVSHEFNYGDNRAAKERAKKLSIGEEANLRRNVSEEDVDAPLQSGVVRVFKQPGIEGPSDEDDFIEVRSKRQMLNDRREQREKELKAKSQSQSQSQSHSNKPPRKPRFTRQKDVVSRSNNKLSAPFGSEEPSTSHFTNNEGSTGYTTAVSQNPVGTPAVNSEVEAIKPTKAAPVSVVSQGGAEHDPFDSKNKEMDLVESTSNTWSAAGINPEVLSLSQAQIDEAMEPARYDSLISPIGAHSSTVSDSILPTPSILTKDKTFSSGASPVNSLLAGEKIQFGAVTSPTVLPSSSRVVSHGIGAPGSNRPDLQMSRNFAVPENENSPFFEKEKHPSNSSVSEAEAEAAASAVAVAAISSDEMVGNLSGSVNNTKSFGAADVDSITAGQHMASQSRGEESLSVSLPADLSVETTPISLWPPLPSPQSSSSQQMLSHFPGAPPSHFPFYEMSPLLGGQIFAFSPHEESSGTQSQAQKSAPSSSGPLGNWQQCHSGVDSFYGHPAGYPGPFISPPGGIPGVQGPPHMVVYNHFAPVGQYGQVGLSFMGTTYIPSGKQADWKNAPTSSSPMHIGEGDVNSMNMTGPIQHLAPGSPLLRMPSPLPMFDVSPFHQNAPDLPVQARWGHHIPTSQLHSVPVSRPLPPQVDGHTIDQSLTVNRFPEPRIPTPTDKNPSFTTTVAADTNNITQFNPELGLVEDSPGQSSVAAQSSSSNSGPPFKTDKGNNVKQRNNPNPVKTTHQQFSQRTQQQQGYNSNYQRNEWSHQNRRMGGFHGRNQFMDNRGYPPPTKIRQIYVAKQTPSGSTSTTT